MRKNTKRSAGRATKDWKAVADEREIMNDVLRADVDRLTAELSAVQEQARRDLRTAISATIAAMRVA